MCEKAPVHAQTAENKANKATCVRSETASLHQLEKYVDLGWFSFKLGKKGESEWTDAVLTFTDANQEQLCSSNSF